MTTLLEREPELAVLERALERAGAGEGSLVVVEGPGGIGKTALLAAARRRAETEGAAVATARGSELERDLAFGVVRQLLEPAAAGGRAGLFAGAAALAEPLFVPDPTLHGRALPSEEHAAVIRHGLFWMCANLAQARPLVLLVDDAQWADLASLRFLAYLAHRCEGLALALVVAARPAETPAEEELLVHLVTDPRAIAISPRPLSRDAVAMLVRAELAPEPDPEFVDACLTATGGTPFLVRELLRAVRERQLRPIAASAARIGDLGPRSVRRAVIARARRLAPEALDLARAVAVLGADAEARRAGWLAGVDDAAAERTLDLLESAGLIRPGAPVEFVHPILRSAVYQDIPAGERGRLHARAAELLAADGSDEERIATHLLATEPRGDEAAFGLLVRIARSALARGAPASAVAHLRRALRERPGGEPAAVLHQLGVAEIHAGQLDAATEHLAEGRRLAAEGPERVRIARDLAAALSIQGRYGDAAAVVAELLDEDLDAELVLALRGELLLLSRFEPAIRSDVEGRLGALEPRADGRSAGARTYLSALALDATLRLRPAADVRDLAVAAREAGLVEEVASGAIAWSQVLFTLMFADGFDLAEQMVAEALEHPRAHASTVGIARAYSARSYLHLRRGALRDAAADAHTAADAAREASFIGRPIALATLVDALVEVGEPAAAQAALETAELDGEIPWTFLHSWFVAARAGLRLAQGRVDEAIASYEELGRRAEHFGLSNPATVGHRSALATALLRRGDSERAASLAAEELELSRRWGAPRAIGISLRVLGLSRGGEDGVTLLRESVEAVEGSGARLEHARSLVELGAAIRRSGRRSEAREPLHAGMELAHRCGAAPLVERAREELLSAGARPRRIMRTGVDALTPTELRVARMAAGPMTNREIAQALFVTQRTIESHLTHVFQKLDIASRAGLAGRLGG